MKNAILFTCLYFVSASLSALWGQNFPRFESQTTNQQIDLTLLESFQNNPMAEEVYNAFEQFNQAYLRADAQLLDQLLTKHYLHANGANGLLRKSEWLSYVKTRKKALENGDLVIHEYQNTNVVIETYVDAAVLSGKVSIKGEQKGKPFSRTIQYTHTWIKEDGRWKRASFHDTTLQK